MFLRKMCFISLALIITLSSFSFAESSLPEYINPEVQVQDNGYLKIVEQYVQEMTSEELVRVFVGLKRGSRLHVKIQFLKPCKATDAFDEYLKKYPPKTDSLDEEIDLDTPEGQCIALYIRRGMAYIGREAGDLTNSSTIEDISSFIDNCGSPLDYQVPQFRCDYRFKVFISEYRPFWSKERETSTSGIFPQAELLGTTGKLKYKEEMLPGETMWITFLLTDAESWYVWVPK